MTGCAVVAELKNVSCLWLSVLASTVRLLAVCYVIATEALHYVDRCSCADLELLKCY